MTEKSFNLIFKGDVEPGHDQDEVRCTLESLFEFDTESQIDFFDGQPVVLGENMDATTAKSFKQALADAGIATHLLEASVTAVAEDAKERRLEHRRIDTKRRARVRRSAYLPDRRLDPDRRA